VLSALSLFACDAGAKTDSDPLQRGAQLKQDLMEGRYDYLVVYYIDYQRRTRIRITTSYLRSEPDRIFIVNPVPDSFIAAFAATSMNAVDQKASLRWAVLFCKSDGQCENGVYLGPGVDGDWYPGNFDGLDVTLEGPLLKWFEETYLKK
jgi:hypothetical protein